MTSLSKNLFNIENNNVIITGTSRGIGQTLAKGFLDSGANVFGLSRTNSELLKKYPRFKHLEIDLMDKNKISDLINDIGNKTQNINTLINCAGVSEPMEEYDLNRNSFKNTLDINLISVFYLSNEVVKFMKKEKYPSIINVTSIGSSLGFPSNPAYISSKAALSGLTRSLAIDFSKYQIRVNNLVPGYFLTEMTRKSYEDENKRQARSSRTVLSRWGDPKELIGPAIFLASEASAYMTGIDLIVDGGWSIKGL